MPVRDTVRDAQRKARFARATDISGEAVLRRFVPHVGRGLAEGCREPASWWGAVAEVEDVITVEAGTLESKGTTTGPAV